MDHSNAQATFIEISFGLNTLFTAYKGFRDRLQLAVEEKVVEFEATTKGIESDPQNVVKATTAKRFVIKIAAQHISVQQWLMIPIIATAIAAAIACVVVAYFDFFEFLGYGNIILIAPLPLYIGISAINYSVFRLRGWRKLRRLKNYIEEFEPSAPPDPPISPEE